MTNSWPRISLGELLRLERRPINVEPTKHYQEIGIYCFGRGVFHKMPRSGLEVGDKNLFLLKEGDFILQVTFAWEGAVAVVSAAEDGMYGSTRYPTFRVDESRCDPQFLLHYFKTHEGIQQLVNICPGSAGRNRVLSIKRVPEVLVPLPAISVQKHVVARLQALAIQIGEARALRQQAAKEAGALVASETNALFRIEANRSWPTKSLGEIADIRAGVTLGRRLTGRTIRVPYLRVANVQDGHLDLTEIKEVEILESEAEKWKLERDDLLLTEGGDWDKLGRGTVWEGEVNNCIHQNHIFRVRTSSPEFIPDFVSKYVGSPIGKAYFQGASKQTTNLASINQRQLKAFRVLQPPIAEQKRIVSELNTLHAKVNALKRLQVSASVELDALLPAILDRAFKGDI